MRLLMMSGPLSTEEKDILGRLAPSLARELNSKGLYRFRNRPVTYVEVLHDRLFVTIADQKRASAEVTITTKRQPGVIGFFVYRFVLKDFMDADSVVQALTEDKVKEYAELTRERNAYSQNLIRSRRLVDDGHYYAALVMLISSFEAASRDIFLRSNSDWFFHVQGHMATLLNKYGHKIQKGSTRGNRPKYPVEIHYGGEAFGFEREASDELDQWASVLRMVEVLNTCEQLGIKYEYLDRLYGNSLKEIGFYEILKDLLRNSKKRPLDFQVIDGAGGMKWCFKRFLFIDLEKVPREMQNIRDCIQKRHLIVHGVLNDKRVTKQDVSELEGSVRRVINFLNDEMMTLDWVLD